MASNTSASSARTSASSARTSARTSARGTTTSAAAHQTIRKKLAEQITVIANLSNSQDNSLNIYNSFYRLLYMLPINTLLGYARSFTDDQMSNEIMHRAHTKLITQVINDMENGMTNNIELYQSMAKMTSMLVLYQRTRNLQAAESKTAPMLSNAPVSALYTNMLPLSTLNEVQLDNMEAKNNVFLETFLNYHGNRNVRDVMQIPVTKYDSTNACTISPQLITELQTVLQIRADAGK